MSNLALIRQTTKQIIELSVKSAILADKKSKEFCKQYLELEKKPQLDSVDNATSFIKYLSSNFGVKTEKLGATVFLGFFTLLLNE